MREKDTYTKLRQAHQANSNSNYHHHHQQSHQSQCKYIPSHQPYSNWSHSHTQSQLLNNMCSFSRLSQSNNARGSWVKTCPSRSASSIMVERCPAVSHKSVSIRARWCHSALKSGHQLVSPHKRRRASWINLPSPQVVPSHRKRRVCSTRRRISRLTWIGRSSSRARTRTAGPSLSTNQRKRSKHRWPASRSNCTL